MSHFTEFRPLRGAASRFKRLCRTTSTSAAAIIAPDSIAWPSQNLKSRGSSFRAYHSGEESSLGLAPSCKARMRLIKASFVKPDVSTPRSCPIPAPAAPAPLVSARADGSVLWSELNSVRAALTLAGLKTTLHSCPIVTTPAGAIDEMGAKTRARQRDSKYRKYFAKLHDLHALEFRLSVFPTARCRTSRRSF